MKQIFMFTFIFCATLYCNDVQKLLEQAIARHDSQTVQTLMQKMHVQHDQTERSPLLQTIGRGVIKTLYEAADEAEKKASENAETRFNKYVAARLLKTGCCAAGVTYQVVKLAMNWEDYQNWTQMTVGVYLAYQGYCEFYQVITNDDAKNKYANARVIKRSLQDLHENIQKSYTVSLGDMEEQRFVE